MILQFSENAWADYLHWQQVDKKLLERVNELIQAIQRDPYQGIGKPEALRHALLGYWSRRINEEHRLVYRVEGDTLRVASARFHY